MAAGLTGRGIEIRPHLVAPLFVRDAPLISAVAIGSEVQVELTTRDGRLVKPFPLGTLDLVAVVEAMLADRSLAHDNLPACFRW